MWSRATCWLAPRTGQSCSRGQDWLPRSFSRNESWGQVSLRGSRGRQDAFCRVGAGGACFPALCLGPDEPCPSEGVGEEGRVCNIQGRAEPSRRRGAGCVSEAVGVQSPRTRAGVANSKLSPPRRDALNAGLFFQWDTGRGARGHTPFSLGAQSSEQSGHDVLGQETWLQSGSLEGDSCL